MNTIRIAAEAATELARQIFVAHGASNRNARIVAEHLVTSDLMGVPSHGLNRVVQYTSEIAGGLLRPAATPAVTTLAPARLQIDGGSGFGQVACMAAVDVADGHGLVDQASSSVAERRSTALPKSSMKS